MFIFFYVNFLTLAEKFLNVHMYYILYLIMTHEVKFCLNVKLTGNQ